MPMIDTPRKSYIADYSHNLYSYPRDISDTSLPYVGPYSIGTATNAMRTFQMFGKPAKGVIPKAVCKTLLKMPENYDTSDTKVQARVNRLQADNCANEYILNWALGPFQDELRMTLAGDDPKNPGKLVDLQSSCQPLRIITTKDNDYKPSDYLKVAWKKTMQDPEYRYSTPSALKNIPCVSKDYPCDHEPHLPKGVKMEFQTADGKALAPPEPFPDMTLSQLSAAQFEKINDPTHPFSPRWDFILNDRQYGNAKEIALFAQDKGATPLAIYALLQVYQEEPENSIFCAGSRPGNSNSSSGGSSNGGSTGGSSSGGDGSGNKDEKKEVLVDVLGFRRGLFEGALKRRTMYNAICYEHEDYYGGAEEPLYMILPVSFCFEITKIIFWPPYIYAKGIDCWKCFGLNKGQKVKADENPPCTTNYLGKDRKMKLAQNKFPGLLNLFNTRALCNYPLQSYDSKYDMKKVCADLRKPFTMMNKLKMRYDNPDEKDNNAMTEGVLEGMRFKDYFGDHMPYPRLWDTGTSLQKTASKDVNNQPADDTTGQYTAIVGVGREGAAKNASGNSSSQNSSNNSINGSDSNSSGDNSKKQAAPRDERCKTMGWGNPLDVVNAAAQVGGAMLGSNNLKAVSFAGTYLQIPDPMTSWTEMKLYQARAVRSPSHVNCLARYEKVFKPYSAENMILAVSGADWSRVIITKCAQDANGLKKDCKDLSLKQYVAETKKSNGNSNDNGGSANGDGSTNDKKSSSVYISGTKNEALINNWRGYMASAIEKNKFQFPKFGGSGSSAIRIGLDYAKPGDIILMPRGPGIANPGLAKLAFVIEANTPENSNCKSLNNCYVRVFEPDNGKIPDVCGTTDTAGMMVTRYYYKEGSLPKAAAAEYERQKIGSSCEETGISHCVMKAWNLLEIYRIKDDRRKHCDKKSVNDCQDDK